MEQRSRKDILIICLKAVLKMLLVLGVIYLIFYLLGWTKISQDELREFIENKGALAPLIFILVSFLQVTFVPIPGSVTILVGNYLFGFWQALLYSYIGMFIGSIVAFWLGKVIGRPFVNWIVGKKSDVDYLIEKLKGREKVLLFFMFFLPFFPDDLLCSVAGILPIRWFDFILIQIVTRFTSIIATLTLLSGEIIPFKGWGLIVFAVLGVLILVTFILAMKYAEKINLVFDKITDKLFPRRKDNEEND